MKKSFPLLVLAVLVSLNGLFAATVSVEKANSIAVNFAKLNLTDAHLSVTAQLNYTQSESDNTVDFYVFNITPGPGFVIVAADDNIEPILAYSYTSNFESGLTKTGVVDWMKHASAHVYRGITENLPATTHIKGLWTAYTNGQKPADMKNTVVAPLVYTNWNQNPKYNDYCPAVNGVKTVTGCVATTMAQIMKYWSYPARGTGSFSYNDGPTPYYSNNIGTLSANFADSTYNWAAMPIAINTSNAYIASLMLQCGISVGMDYGTEAQNGSGAQVIAQWGGPCAQTAYTSYFSYDPNTIQGVSERDYSASDWLNLIKTDLNAGRPVQYVGSDPSGGHTWVCDGYDGNGLLHMNWGWGGSDNGYFNVNALTAGGYNFSTNEQALIGIQPLTPVANAATHITICAGDTVQLNAVLVNHATYSWSPAIGLACTTCAFTAATPAGTTVYTAKIDSAGTIKNTTYIISVTPRVSANATMVNLTCNGGANGVLDVAAAGGIPTYTYTWSNGLTSPSSNTLAAGSYTVTVTDAVGCSAVIHRTLTQPAGINAVTSTTPATACATATGTAAINAWGGAGSLTYLWSNMQTSANISDLASGTYKVTVTDLTQCTTVVDAVVGQPDQIESTTTSTNTINGQHVGSATVDNVTGGSTPYSYMWSDGETAQSISGLEAGTYTVTITDHNGCYQTSSVTIESSPAAAIANVTDAFSFSVYPNPAHSQTIIQLSQVTNGTSLKLENILGQVLISRPVTEMQTQLDLSSYPDGVYLIEVKQNGRRAVKQIVLSR